MKTFLLTTLLVCAVSGARPGARIIGGRDANAGEFPFVAAVNKQTPTGLYFCSATLLNQQWLLTSGSCVDGATLFQIRLGLTHLDDTGSNVVTLATDEYVLHESYNPLTLDSDIGLIKLRLPISYTQYIQPIRLPARDVAAYSVVTAVGWGQTSDEDAGLVNNLQAVILTALSNQECSLVFGAQITDSMVCVDGNYNEGTCNGDTGGPLVQYINVVTPTVAAVSSFISGSGCESTDPSGYTRIIPFVDWIEAQMIVGSNA